MKFTLIVMTLNELEGMRIIMPRVEAGWFEQILVVDGGSTDGTVAWARQQGYEVVEQMRAGLRHGYNEARPHIKGEAVVTFSPDGNSIPELLPALMAELRKGYDMVIASRYLGGAKSEDDGVLTAFGNWLFTTAINVLHGGRYTDAMVIYRAYRTSLFEELDLNKDEGFAAAEKLFFTTISIEPLLSIRAAKRKLKIGEIPGDEPPRIGGERKLKIIQWGGAYMFQVIRELFCWR